MKIIKRIFPITLAILFILTSLEAFTVNASYKTPFEIASRAAYLVNLDTDTVVFEKNANEKIYPASLTKIMTAIIALENVDDLENTVVTSKAFLYDEFYGLNVSNADIKKGEEVRMIDLLYAMMLQSACEASSIIADYVGGGNITEFVELMNKKAKEIGANDTVFKNAHGLHDEEQKSTAHDMYLIAKYAMSIPMFEKISTTVSYLMPATNKHSEERYVIHTNNMLSRQRGGQYYYQYARGIKTGALPEVGKNLISTASKDGYNYMLVTLNAPATDANGNSSYGTYTDAKSLYEWAFSSFKQKTIVKAGDVVDETSVKLSSEQDYVHLLAKNDVIALLPSDADITAIQKVKTKEENIKAPIKKDAVLGKMELKVNNEVIATVDLIAAQDIDRSTLLYSLDVLKRFSEITIVRILFFALIILILIYIILRSRYKKLKRMRAARMRMNVRTK